MDLRSQTLALLKQLTDRGRVDFRRDSGDLPVVADLIDRGLLEGVVYREAGAAFFAVVEAVTPAGRRHAEMLDRELKRRQPFRRSLDFLKYAAAGGGGVIATLAAQFLSRAIALE